MNGKLTGNYQNQLELIKPVGTLKHIKQIIMQYLNNV